MPNDPAKKVLCLSLTLAVALLSGCGGDGLKRPGGTLKGKITYQGKELKGRGSITLNLVDDSGTPIAGSNPSGHIDNSAYSIAGIPAGRYELWFWIPEIDGYDESNPNTGIFVQATGAKNQTHDIDLPPPAPFKKQQKKR